MRLEFQEHPSGLGAQWTFMLGPADLQQLPADLVKRTREVQDGSTWMVLMGLCVMARWLEESRAR